MSGTPYRRDLTVLAADQTTQLVLQALISRRPSLGIREIRADFHRHPGKDPGCLSSSHRFLEPFHQSSKHALVVFDREGCAAEQDPRGQIESTAEELLSANGWDDRASVVVIDPELEQWIWADSRNVDLVLGWKDKEPSLRCWLETSGLLVPGMAKPDRPKEAMLAALRAVRKTPSSSLHREIAQKVTFDRCIDGAFLKLKSVLQAWFPAE